MNVVEYKRYGAADVTELCDRPAPEPGAGQIRVRIAGCALNPKDVLVRAGKFVRFTGKRFPRRMGYDFSGQVDALGADVTNFKVGDPVFGMLNGWDGGACAESVLAPVGEVAAAPKRSALVDAAAIPLAAQTALQALRDLARVEPGSRVCVHGASGGVGTFAVQIAKALGANITALCSAANHPLVRELGADVAIDYRDTPPQRLPDRYDCFFDVFGNQSLSRVRERLTPHGVYVSTVPSLPNIRADLLTRFWPGRRGRLIVVRSRRADLEQLARWVDEGRLKPVIDTVLLLSQIVDAQLRIESKRTRGKIVLIP
jgi:NADPH:quinone reductase-like Zn-dependent oxidoreductase